MNFVFCLVEENSEEEKISESEESSTESNDPEGNRENLYFAYSGIQQSSYRSGVKKVFQMFLFVLL